jgi:hypothetical protein
MAALTCSARSCSVQCPQPGSMIADRSLGTIADWMQPPKANKPKRPPPVIRSMLRRLLLLQWFGGVWIL